MRRILTGALMITSLLLAGVADGSLILSYRGRTSQHQRVAFSVSRGYLRKLQYYILDRCPNHKVVRDHDTGFPPIRIKHSKFDGTFRDPGRAVAVVRGSVSGRRARGSLIDTVKYRGSKCHGYATFSLKPH